MTNKQAKDPSPRQELGVQAESGNLRSILHYTGGLSDEAINLAVQVIRNYCAPRRKRRG